MRAVFYCILRCNLYFASVQIKVFVVVAVVVETMRCAYFNVLST